MEAIPSPPSLNQPATWDDLRRSVRTLESDVEIKLSTFQTLTTNLLHGKDGDMDEAMDMQRTVEEMTGRLSSNVAQMASLIESGQFDNKTTMLHHLQRHRDVLFDFERELRKGKVPPPKMTNRQKE
jgi:Golgi SNAP receptor complex protein 1